MLYNFRLQTDSTLEVHHDRRIVVIRLDGLLKLIIIGLSIQMINLTDKHEVFIVQTYGGGSVTNTFTSLGKMISHLGVLFINRKVAISDIELY